MPEIGKVRLDDTPVNRQLDKGITSNWAYDEDVTIRALIETTLPWIIFIPVLHTPKSHVNFNTNYVDPTYLFNAYKLSSGAQNDEITWDIVLAAGTWSIELIYTKFSSAGIFSIQFDSVEKGTIDSYASSPSQNNITSITGITVAITKKVELKLKMDTKNASSAAYSGALCAVRLIRTA